MLTVVTLLAVAAGAHADPPDEAGPIPDPSLRWELGGGPFAGAVTTNLGHGGEGFRLHGGIELDRFALLGELEWLHLDRACAGPSCGGDEAPGSDYRALLEGRVSVARGKVVHHPRGGRARLERMDLYLVPNVGVETVAIGVEPARSRPIVGLDLSWAMTNRAGHASAALRVGFSLARAWTDPAVGRTTEPASQPTAVDGSFLVGFDVFFGD